MGSKPLQSALDADDALLGRLSWLLGQSRRVESEIVAVIAEVDARRLYAREASPSMFAYCTQVLHLSEAEAYLRIEVARASREFPVLLDMLGDGRLHLSGIVKLVPHLTRENVESLLERATHKSKRQIEELIADIAPKPDVPSVIRKLPSSVLPLGLQPGPVDVQLRPDGVEAPRSGALVEPIAPARYKVQFTASAELQAKLERLQALMPGKDLAAVIEAAVTEKLERIEARRFARTTAPRKESPVTTPTSRHIPAGVRRTVCARDGNRCRYVDKKGRRCTERHQLEFHHRHPYGMGGDHDPRNIRLMCRTHNAYVAELDYGKAVMERHRRSRASKL